jgi:hypothetical protein
MQLATLNKARVDSPQESALIAGARSYMPFSLPSVYTGQVDDNAGARNTSKNLNIAHPNVLFMLRILRAI